MYLAVAEPIDLSNDNWMLILVGLGLFAVAAILVAGAIGLARWRGHRHVAAIGWLAALWAFFLMITVGSALYQEYAFAAYRALMLRTHNYDPSIDTNAPLWPWGMTIGLGVAYGGILLSCLLGGRKGPSGNGGRS